jgi:hypothetical protein
MSIARDARERGWWEKFRDEMGPQQALYADLEAGARSIAEFFGMDLDTARASYALMLPAWTADGAVDRQGIEAIVQQEVADGNVAAPAPYEQLADPSVVAEALRALGPAAN